MSKNFISLSVKYDGEADFKDEVLNTQRIVRCLPLEDMNTGCIVYQFENNPKMILLAPESYRLFLKNFVIAE